MNDLETRLAAALDARADLLDPADLSPGEVPSVTRPVTRLRPALVGGGVLVAAAATVVALLVTGTDDGVDRPGPSTPDVATDTSEPTPDPTPPPDPTPDAGPGPVLGVVPDGLLPADETAWSRDGETVAYDDGSTATVTGTRAVVTRDGATLEATLPAETESGLAPYQLDLGAAGAGYLVLQSAGEFASNSLLVVRDGELVVADVQGEAPLGSEYDERFGARFETWTTGQGAGLWTRVLVDRADYPANAYAVFGWDVTTGDDGVTMTSRLLGAACFAADGSSYENCPGQSSGQDYGATLLPEDDVRYAEPGTTATYADGSSAEIIPTGGGFELAVTRDGTTVRVPAPGTGLLLVRRLVLLGDTTGYLVSEEGGDSTVLRLFVVDGDDVVAATESPDLPDGLRFGGGFTEDGGYLRTYLAGGGEAAYTEVQADFDDPESTVYAWDVGPGAVLVATPVSPS